MPTEDDTVAQQVAKEEKPDIQIMQILVRAQDGAELQFKIKKHTPFQKVFTAYCAKKGLQEKECRFMYEGQRLQGDKTPEYYEMEDADMIDMVQEQQGGCCTGARGH